MSESKETVMELNPGIFQIRGLNKMLSSSKLPLPAARSSRMPSKSKFAMKTHSPILTIARA